MHPVDDNLYSFEDIEKIDIYIKLLCDQPSHSRISSHRWRLGCRDQGIGSLL